jgi:hypothetical protein
MGPVAFWGWYPVASASILRAMNDNDDKKPKPDAGHRFVLREWMRKLDEKGLLPNGPMKVPPREKLH